MDIKIFTEICQAYKLKGDMMQVTRLKRGHINDTYRVDLSENGKEKSYLFQRVNDFVFKNPQLIVSNVRGVTAHIRHKLEKNGEPDIKRRVLKLYEHDGEGLYYTEDKQCWRVMSFVYNATTYSEFDLKKLYAIGFGFGRFLALLSDFPAGDLFETIPDFHNTPKRFQAFFDAYKEDTEGRAVNIKEEYDYVCSVCRYADRFEKLYMDHKIPMRVVHNDTKGNNIMMDIETDEPLAVIDLDTVMPGFAMYDFGDAVRYAANTAAEDEGDLSKVSLDIDRYEALAEGFLRPIADKFTEIEMRNMPWGVILATLETAVRFLTDYLQGDVYFKVEHSDHNLLRGRCQLALAKDAFKKLNDMEKITEKYIKI
ncbi:MAG: aminoglycoside phosphotransferase family protein [Clostridia bacterium]|nr:aminoglycoside phosphotransferase family protein [Clostridia bacterium]